MMDLKGKEGKLMTAIGVAALIFGGICWTASLFQLSKEQAKARPARDPYVAICKCQPREI